MPSYGGNLTADAADAVYAVSRDTSRRHSTDQLLRRHGYSIHERPPGGEPVWRKDGLLYGEAEALRRVSRALKSVETG